MVLGEAGAAPTGHLLCTGVLMTTGTSLSLEAKRQDPGVSRTMFPLGTPGRVLLDSLSCYLPAWSQGLPFCSLTSLLLSYKDIGGI